MFTAAHCWLSHQFSMFVLCILFVFVLCIVSNAYSCPFLVVSSVFYDCVVHFVCLRYVFVSNVYSCPFLVVPSVFYGYNTQNEEKQNTQHKHRKPTGQPGMGSCKHWIQYTERRKTKYSCVFCLSSFCLLYPMFTAAHCLLSRQFSMCVLCILFFFVLCIISNVYSCPFLVTIKIHNTNIENLQDNQEWAAVNIGYKHRTKTNKIHNTNIEN
jgi:hypothetical protein